MFTESGSRILEKLVALTDADKLKWKPGESRKLEATHDGHSFSIILKNRGAKDRHEFIMEIRSGEKRLMKESVRGDKIDPELIAFYEKCRAMEPAASILDSLAKLDGEKAE